MKSISYAMMMAMTATLVVGAPGAASAGQKDRRDVVVATTGPNPVKADPAPKPNPVGQKISDYKPPVKVKPAAPPPPPKPAKR